MNIHELKELILKEPNQNLEVYGEDLDDIIYISKLYTPEYPILVRNVQLDRFYHCPYCQTRLDDLYKPNFCSNCGKALKWKEVDND